MTSLRSRLFHGTAVAAALVLAPSAVAAASPALPNGGTIASGSVTATIPMANTSTLSTSGGSVGSTITLGGAVGASDALTLTVGSGNHNSAVINWSGGFDIGSGNTVTFVGPSTTTPFSVLNRVTSGSITTIAGTLQGNVNAVAGSRGTVFVSNESGITFANSATVTNLTGLVASSLDISVGDFNAFAAGTQPLHFAGTGSSAVTVDADAVTHATIAPDSVLLLVAPSLNVNGGMLSATDAGFVLASDAKVALSTNSIISIEIDKGTAITSSVLNGTVGGQHVLVAAASSTDLMASLLGVGGNLTATTATATDHGIVIAIGHDAPIDATNSITFAPPTVPALPTDGAQFVAGLTVSGTLTSSGRVDTVSTGGTTLGAVTAGGGASFAAGTGSLLGIPITTGGNLTLGGNIAVSAGDLTASGTSVLLGATSVSGTIAATGNIGVTATGGTITAAGPTAITANSGAAAGASNVTLTALGGIGDTTNPEFIALAGTTTNPAAAIISIGAGADLHLGAVTASSLTSMGSALTTTGAITLGPTIVASDLQISTTGDVAIDAATSGGSIAVSGNNVTLTGNVSAAADYTITGNAVSLGGVGTTQTAVGDVLVRAATGDINGSGTLTADSGGAGGHVLVLDASIGQINASALNVSSGTKSDIYLNTASDLALGTINANELASATLNAVHGTPPLATDYTPVTANTVTVPGAITLGAVTTAQSVTIASTGTLASHQDVNAGNVSSGGAIAVSSATGAVTLAGAASGGTANNVTVGASGVATISGGVTATGDYKVSGSSVSLGGAGIAQTAAGDVLIKSTSGGISVATTGVTGSLTADSGGVGAHVLVLDSNAAISGGGNLSAGTLSDVLLAVNGDITLGSINANQFASTATAALPLAASNYSAAVANTLATSGAITLGAVTTRQANTIASTGTTAGHQDVFLASDISSTGGVTLSSANNVTVGQLGSGGVGGDIMVTATGGIATISGPVVSARDYLVTGDSVVLGKLGAGTSQTAQRNLTITATGGAITAPDALNLISNATSTSGVGAGNLTLTAATNIGDPAHPGFISVYGGQINGNAASRRAITLDVTTSGNDGSISLGNIRGASLTGPAAAPLAAAGPIALGNVDVASDLSVTSSAALSLISGVAAGNIALGGTTITLGANGAANALTTATPAATVTLTASGGGAAAITTLGNFAISAPGAVVLQQSLGTPANVTQDDSLAITGSSVSVGSIALAAVLPTAVGTGDVVLTANGSAITDAASAGTVAARSAVNVSSAAGAVTLGGARSGGGVGGVTTPHDITVTAARTATVSGAVTATGNYTVTGGDVSLGGAGVVQTAVGDVLVRAATGDISGSGTLTADSNAAGGHFLVLDASIGQINAPSLNLSSGTLSDVYLHTGSDLVLGAINANELTSATLNVVHGTPPLATDYTPVGANFVTVQGAITLGAVTTVQSNTIESTGTATLTAGDTSTGGGVEILSTNGAISITGLVKAHSSVELFANDLLSVGTVEAFGGDAVLSGLTGVTVASGSPVLASGNVSIGSSGDIVLSDVHAGHTVYIAGNLGGAAASVTAGSLEANGAITVSATGAIDLTGGTTVATHRNLLDPVTLTTFNGTPTAPDADVTLTGGTISVRALASTGSITLNGTGVVSVPGTVTAGDGATMTGSGNYTVIGGNVVAGGAGVAQTATGDILLRSTVTNVAAAGTLNAGGTLVIDSATSIDGIPVALPTPTVTTAALVAGGDVLLRNGTGAAISLGNITAARLATATTAAATPVAVGDYAPLLIAGIGTLQSGGAIALGAVATTQSSAILATGTLPGQRDIVLAGDTSSAGSVEVGSSNGAITITGLVSANTSVDLHADYNQLDLTDPTRGKLSVATVKAFHSSATLIGGTGITVAPGNPVAASGAVNLLSDGAIAVDAVRSGGVITVGGLTAGTGAASLTENGLAANGGISITTVGAIDVTPSGLALVTPRTVINSDLSGFNPANAPYVGTANIALTSTASSVKAAAITATGSITLTAATSARVTGNVAAGSGGGSGNYTVIGGNVVAGGVGVAQTATGDILLRSTTTNVAAAGTLTAGGRLVVDSTTSIDGITSASPPVVTTAALVAGGDVLLRSGAGAAITLGNITADRLATATTMAATPTTAGAYDALLTGTTLIGTLQSSGAITLGTVTTTQSNAILATGTVAGQRDIVLGGDTSLAGAGGGDVTVSSTNGSVTTLGLVKAGTNATLTAGGALTVADVTVLNGSATLTGQTIGAIAGSHTISASGAVALQSPGAITLTADGIVGGAITVGGTGGAGSAATSFAADSLHASGPITVTTTGDITLAGVNATSLVTSRATPLAADGDIGLTSQNGTIALKDATTTGSLSLTTGGAATVTGPVVIGDATTLPAGGNYVIHADGVTLGGVQSATGNIEIASPGAIGVGTLAAGGMITADGATAGSGAASFSATTLQANGAISVTTTGSLILTGTGAAASATERKGFNPTLRTFTRTGLPSITDQTIALTSKNGTVTAADLASTGDIMIDAGGAVTVSGTAAAGEGMTLAGGGNFTVVAHDLADASTATINARGSVSVSSQTNNALIGTATAGLNAAVGGSITAQTLGTGAAAVITSGTATGGDIKALATGTGSAASITAATATQGNILADGDAQALVGMGTADGAVTAHSLSGTATITTGMAGGDVLASAGTAATIFSGTATNGNVDALGGTTATITLGTAGTTGSAALGNVRATSTGGGVATITTAMAAQSVVANGGAAVVGNATAGDDIILIANNGTVTATTLSVTGAASGEAAATDANGSAVLYGGGTVTGLGGSNIIIRASGAATISGTVGVAQPDAAKTANYDVMAGSIILGTSGNALSQSAAGSVNLRTTSGGIVFASSGGTLTSNVGGARTTIALADGTTAGSDLSLMSAAGITGTSTNIVATQTADAAVSASRQARQPGVTLTAAPGGSGSIQLAGITGGAVTVSAPVAIAVPLITATGNVALTGNALSGNDTATVDPTTLIIDGVNTNAGYGRVDVTIAGGHGAEIAAISVLNGGQIGALQVLSDSGAATLRATPSDPSKITSILVESQTGVAGILNPAGGAASSANPNTVAAQTIVLRGRQTGSSVVAAGPLLATGSILATGPSVTIGTVAVAGTPADGTGDILIAATDTASLAAGATETAVARRTINVGGGTATLGDGTATGGTLAVSGTAVTVLRNAVAGDDIVLTSTGPITATNAVVRTNGTADLQSGNDTANLGIVSVGTAAGTGYGSGHTVDTNVLTSAVDTVTGGNLTRLAGSNIVATATGAIDFSAATLTATAGRDVHVEAGGTVNLATASAARQFIGASGGTFTTTGSIAAGDDLVLGAGGAIDVHTATLRTIGGAADVTDARRADGTLMVAPVAGGTLTNLAGSNIALAAAGPIQLGAITTTTAPSSLRAYSGAAITTTQALSVSGDIALVGTTVTSNYALAAGDDIVAVAKGGAATLAGGLTTTGSATSDAALVDLHGTAVALPGEGALGRVDGSSILVAATGTATVSTNVASAGRYSVYGRGGIVLGTTGAGTSQSAAGDVLLEASIGAAPAPASVTLADGMILTANSDGVEAARSGGFVADPLVIRVGNGSVAAGGATLRVVRTSNATLADQGTVQIQPVVADGVTDIAIQTLDSASADLRAAGDVTIGSANIDAGLTLASKNGTVSMTTLTVGTAVPLMTAAQVNAIDVKLAGATGATLGTVTTGTNLVRDITVATVGGDASITAASARDDIVIASTTGRAVAGDLTFAGTASDSEAGVTTVAATDANGVALADPYGLTGTTITGLAGRNIVVSGATAATLNSVTTTASDGLGDVRVLAATGPATLTTINTGGAGLPARVIVATRNGVATGTSLSASGDIIVDATAGSAVLTSGNAGRDAIVVAPTVSIGTLTAGDDIVAVATAGPLTAGTLTSTGTNSADGIATIARADGSSIVDPVNGGTVGGLSGGNVVALASGDLTVTNIAALTPTGGVAGAVRIGSKTGAATVTNGIASSGDLIVTGQAITSGAVAVARDAMVTVTGAATLPMLTAGRDVTITAASAELGTGTGGLIAAQRNFLATTTGALTIGTARAGGDLTATGGSVLATTLGAGDALTVAATGGDATVTTATSTGLPLLADYSGFAASGTALGSTPDITVTATGAATVTTATAAHSISLSGDSAAVVTATANTGGTDGDLTVTGATAGATLGTGSGRDVLVSTTSGDVTVGSATALRDIILTTEDGTATLTTGTSGRDTRVTGSNVTVMSAAADTAAVGGDLVLVATGATLPTEPTLAGDAVLGQGAGRDISITAANQATATTATASRDLIMTASSVTLVTGMAGRDILLTGEFGPAFGTVDVTSATANTAGGGGILQIRGNTTLQFGSGFDIDIAGDNLALATLVAAHDVSTNSTFNTTVDTVSAGHGIDISGSNVAVTSATANVGGTDGDLAVIGTQGNAILTAGSGRDVRVTASAGGSAQAGTIAATRDLFVDARALNAGTPGGTASLGTGTAGRDAVIVGPTVTIGSVTAAANVVAVADAGTLTATTLASTGAIGGDGLGTIARADGSPVLDPTVAGSPAIGSLAGGNVVALASGDLAVGTATATAAPGATALGLVRLASLGSASVTSAVATAGDVTVTGATVGAGTLSAGRDATVTATAGDVQIATIGSGRDLVLTASNDIGVAGIATATGKATLTAGRDINLDATATGDALDVGSNATLASGRDIVVARPVTVGLALVATAGGAASFAGTNSGGATTIGTQGNLTLTGDTKATGALALTSAGGAITAPDISGNGITVAAANAVTVSGATTSGSGLSVTGGSVALGTVASALDTTLHATGAIAVGGATTTGGALTATSDTGAIQMAAVTTGGPATITASDPGNGSIVLASLGTTGSATVLAGQSATVTGLVQTSGALTATATNGGLSFGALTSGAAATLRARLALAVAGQAQAATTLDALSSAGAISLGSAQASTVTLRGATGVAVFGGTAATGPVTITADAGGVTMGDISAGAATTVTAANGAVTLASVSKTTGLTITAGTDATVTGDTDAGSDVAVTATGGSATLGSVSNAGKLTLTAANNATVGGSVRTTADTLITATNGSATVGGAVQTANYTIKANNGTIALGSGATATQASSGLVTLDSQRLTLGGGVALVGTKQIQLDVTGNAAGVSLGDGPGAAAGATKYALSKADLRKLQSPIVEIAAGGLSVDIGEVDLDGVTPVAGGFAGITNALGIRTTGNIRIADRLTFTSSATAATPRVLTLGGAAGGADLDKTTSTANAIEVLAIPGLDNSTTGTGGQINATGSTVQLRATYIALGETPSPLAGRPFIDALLPASGTPLTTAETRTQYVDNASSSLYVAIPPYAKQTPAPQALVSAGTLVLAPGQWALIQNTGPTTTPGGGIIATTLKFNKVAGAAAADPEIAVFGSIAGKTGIASAISIDSANLDGISPNNIRVNGCVALSTAGCIQSAVSIPLINLADPGQSLLISSAPDLALSVELITGATNEALWREDDDAPGQNRPQRESRP